MNIPKLGAAVEGLKCIKCKKGVKDQPDNIMDCMTRGCPFKKVVLAVVKDNESSDE